MFSLLNTLFAEVYVCLAAQHVRFFSLKATEGHRRLIRA